MWFRDQFTEDELQTIDLEKQRILNDIRLLDEFTVRSHHLTLLSKMNFDFGGQDYDCCYEGIFCSSDKRPFSSKDWASDIATAMGEYVPDYENYMDWYKKNYLKYYLVFQEMQIVINLAIQFAGRGGIQVDAKYVRIHSKWCIAN